MNSYDTKMSGKCKPPYPTCGCDSVKGNSIEVELNRGDCEIRADVTVARTSGVRVWGRVKDCNGLSVANALVKLVKVVNNCGKIDVIGIAHTMTDCSGFYQFEISCCEVGAKYRVLVHKAASGNERVLTNSDGDCDPCNSQVPCPPVPPCPPCTLN